MPMTQSRRRFLGASLGAAAAAFVAANRPARTIAGHDTGGFSIGIQTYSLRGFPVEQALEHAAEIGFAGVEFYDGHYSIDSTAEQIAAMTDRLASLGLAAYGHGVNGFTKDHEANRKLFAFAKQAGIKNLSADPDPDSFESLDKLVAEYDIRIAIHNHGPDHRYDKAIDVQRAIEDHDPRIGACADLGHYIRSSEDPVEVIRLFGKRLFGIHLKDFAEQKKETKGVILGKGHLDVPAVFLALKQVEFPADGALSLEYEENEKDPIADLRECLAVAQEAARMASG